MLRFDTPNCERCWWKVLEVKRDNNLRIASNRSGRDVPIFQIVGHEINKRLVSGNKCFWEMQLHLRK